MTLRLNNRKKKVYCPMNKKPLVFKKIRFQQCDEKVFNGEDTYILDILELTDVVTEIARKPHFLICRVGFDHLFPDRKIMLADDDSAYICFSIQKPSSINNIHVCKVTIEDSGHPDEDAMKYSLKIDNGRSIYDFSMFMDEMKNIFKMLFKNKTEKTITGYVYLRKTHPTTGK